MKWTAVALALSTAALLVSPVALRAQTRSPRGLYATVFRSPSTGFEFRRGALAVNAGFYPTILTADGQTTSENTNFLRFGFSGYLRSHGLAPYISPGLLVSLDDDWGNGVITEAGLRIPVVKWLALRGGVGVITMFNGDVRVNPTVGMDIRLGGK